MALRVLVIDDEPFTVEMMTLLLEMDGFQVKSALTIPDAWELLTYEPLPDAICCDLMLPGITGLDFLAQRAEKPEVAAIPVIIITGCSKLAWLQKAEQLGAYACVGKPFNMKELTSLITQAVYENTLIPV